MVPLACRVGSLGVTCTVMSSPDNAKSGTPTRSTIGLAALMMMDLAVRMPSTLIEGG